MAKKVSNKENVVESTVEVKFEHDNKYLFVSELNVQFRNGCYKTSEEKEIDALRKVLGVREV